MDREPAESVVFTSRKFRVARLTVASDGDGPRVMDIVRHPGAVVILPILSPREIVMIRNRRPAVGCELWELPAGTLDQPGESIEAAAARELEEEAGYVAGGWTRLCEMHPSPGILDERIVAFTATDLRPTRQRLDPGERITVEIVTTEQALAMCRDGTITDAKTLVTLLRWQDAQRNG